MFISSSAIEQYLFTIGVLVSFVGVLIGVYFSRKQIAEIFRERKIDSRKLLLSIVIVLVFVSAELLIVKPTQQLFFDDTIYQDMALNLLHMGQAWMCIYGSANTCIVGSTFHEPIGTAFLLAIGFAAFGLGRATAYGTMFFIASISVFMTFVVALLLSKNFSVAIISEFIMALSPVLLVWAYPTTSDMPMLAFSLIAIAMMLIFLERRNMATLFTALMALSMLTYMKIDGVVYLVVIPLFYILVSDSSLKQSILNNLRRIRKYWLDTRFLLVILVFILAIAPEIGFAANELFFGSFGYQG
ncbi:MAG: glycosyltransferase family 39 protein, partial [Methanothrix sp.]